MSMKAGQVHIEKAIKNEFPEEIGLLLKGYLLKELATCALRPP